MIYVHINIILDLPITITNASVTSQSEYARLHQTVKLK